MKFLLSKKICERLKKDRDLSLELAKYMRLSEQSVLRHLKMRNEVLVNARQIEFFKSKGYTYEEIVASE